VIVVNDQKAEELSLIENVQRNQMSTADKVRAYGRLYEVYHNDMERVKEAIHVSKSTLQKYIKIKDLPGNVLERLDGKGQNRITLDVAVELAKFDSSHCNLTDMVDTLKGLNTDTKLKTLLEYRLSQSSDLTDLKRMTEHNAINANNIKLAPACPYVLKGEEFIIIPPELYCTIAQLVVEYNKNQNQKYLSMNDFDDERSKVGGSKQIREFFHAGTIAKQGCESDKSPTNLSKGGTLFWDIETTGLSATNKVMTAFCGMYDNGNECIRLIFQPNLTPAERSHKLDIIRKALNEADTLVVYNGYSFDYRFLEQDFDTPTINRWKTKTVDPYYVLKREGMGQIRLDILANTNDIVGKSGSGMQAIYLFEQRRYEDLLRYCQDDVRILKDLWNKTLITAKHHKTGLQRTFNIRQMTRGV